MIPGQEVGNARATFCRSSAWLSGLLLVVTGLGLAGSLIRYRLCGTCDGLAYYLAQAIKPRHPAEALPRLDCPDCGDRRNISLFKSWMMPNVAEPVSLILRSLCGPEEGGALVALKQLVLQDGKNPDDLQLQSSDVAITNARFFESEGKTSLLLLLETEAPAAEIVMIEPEGRVLDYVRVACTDSTADLRAAFLKDSGPDGTSLVVLSPLGSFAREAKTTLSYRLDQWGRPPRQEVIPWKPGDAIFRLRLRGDRLECLR
jgi:hypothetical protein